MPLVGKTSKNEMCISNTPIEDYSKQYHLWVKREDLSCPPPGPPFSKTRGVFAHLQKRPEKMIGVLDTFHSQAGHAVARACQILGKQCINFYPKYKGKEKVLQEPQLRSQELDAQLWGLQAGRSCILYHQARKIIDDVDGYMMPNALKLEETIEETAKECNGNWDNILIAVSSGTIAAGVLKGFDKLRKTTNFIIHMGYDRSQNELLDYIWEKSDATHAKLTLINQGYAYKDKARAGETPPWPCNPYYDLKAFRWWYGARMWEQYPGRTLFWNVG